MQLFTIEIKREPNESLNLKKEELVGYLVKKNDEDDTVEGFMRILYQNGMKPLYRYVKGIYVNSTSLVLLEMANVPKFYPICYCFPNITEEGYWSSLNRGLGFFPVIQNHPCSNGRATLCLKQVEAKPILVQQTSEFFIKNSSDAIWINKCVMDNYKSLTDFLGEPILSQIKLHCGEW